MLDNGDAATRSRRTKTRVTIRFEETQRTFQGNDAELAKMADA